MNQSIKINRRKFLKITAAAGGSLMIGSALYRTNKGLSQADLGQNKDFGNLGIWIRITEDDRVTIAIPKSEMGQGITTSLSMIIADELGARWSSVQTEWAPLAPIYGLQMTSASRSVHDLWQTFRIAGAVARTMLTAAAAIKWNNREQECYVENGEVVNRKNGKRLTFGQLVPLAAQQAIPEKITLKNPDEFQIIGRNIPNIEAEKMVTGKMVYGYDIKLPGMLTAVVERSPVFGGTVKSYNEEEVLSVKGVHFVFPVFTPRYDKFTYDFPGRDFLIELIGKHQLKKVYRFVKELYGKAVNQFREPAFTGVAIVGQDFWSANKGRRALKVQWNDKKNSELSNQRIEKLFQEMEKEFAGKKVVDRGDIVKGKKKSEKIVESTYIAPFLAHAPMEPMNCTAHVRQNDCEIWAPTQRPMDALNIARQYIDLPREKIKIHKIIMGGSFGRRQHNDFVGEAVQISKAVDAPVKVLWMREDDLQNGFYRPLTYNKLSAGLNKHGVPEFWHHRIVGKGTDVQLIKGIDDTPYTIPHKRIELIRKTRLVPTAPFCGVAGSQNGFITESFMDEIACKGNYDPLELRLGLLKNKPRHIEVLKKVAELAGWGKFFSKRRFQGLSLYTHYKTLIAHIAEVSVIGNSLLRLERVFCVVDCGRVVNPAAAKKQIEGRILFGLGQVTKNQITIKYGRVEQSNFHNYRIPRMKETPDMVVRFIESHRDPAGVGELGAIGIVAAVTNAIFAATGKRIVRLPLFGNSTIRIK